MDLTSTWIKRMHSYAHYIISKRFISQLTRLLVSSLMNYISNSITQSANYDTLITWETIIYYYILETYMREHT